MVIESLLTKNKKEIFGTDTGYWMAVPCPCKTEEIVHVLNAYLEQMEAGNARKTSEMLLVKGKDMLRTAKDLKLDVVVDYIIAEIADGFELVVETLPEKIITPLYEGNYDLVDEEKEKLTDEEKLKIKYSYVALCSDGAKKAHGRVDSVSKRIEGLEGLLREFKKGLDLVEVASCKVHDKDYLNAVVTNIGQMGAMPAVLICCDTQHRVEISMKSLKRRWGDGSTITEEDIEEFNLSQGGIFNYRVVGYACGCGNAERRKPKIIPFWAETQLNTTKRRPSYECRACGSLIGISFPHRGSFKPYDPNLIKSKVPLDNYI